MGLRKGRCYTTVKRAYTRRSKYKSKAYVKSVPVNKIIKYKMGDLKKEFPVEIMFKSNQAIQIRHNALESARILVNRHLIESLGNNFRFVLRLYPHHVLRENKMLTGAGADRMQSGMQRAFGKPVGLAARVKKGQVVFSVYLEESSIPAVRSALSKAKSRLPGTYSMEVIKPKSLPVQ